MSSDLKPSPWVDSHCHLADGRLDSTRAALVERSESAGIGVWIQGGVSPDDWRRQRELQATYGDRVVTTYGLHPWWVNAATDAEVDEGLRRLADELPKAGGLGETGLDRSQRLEAGVPTQLTAVRRARQSRAFLAQLELANRFKKPLVLHVVQAHGDALQALKRQGVSSAGGLVHSFSASLEVARQYLDLGLSLSISGVITRRKGFESLKRAVVSIPADRILLETDSPDQPLDGHAGELNEPARLLEVAKALAELRGGSAGEWLERSSENARRIFSLEN